MAQLLPMSDEMIASFGSAHLDRPPGHARRSCAPGAPGPGPLVPGRAGIIVLVVHRGQGCCSQADLVWWIRASRLLAVMALPAVWRQADRGSARQPVSHRPRCRRSTLLGQSDAVGVDVDLDNLRVLRPVVDAVAGKSGERVEARSERQHHVGLLRSAPSPAFDPL